MGNQVDEALDASEVAQLNWASNVLRVRLKLIGRVAGLIAARHKDLLEAIERPCDSRADVLASEVLPLADACRFTAKRGRQLLSPRTRPARNGAWWMGRIRVSTVREPWGLVLILGPSNYPLFLPGVQMIQALAAGNAVIVKPAEGCKKVLEVFTQCLVEAGIPEELVVLLPSDVEYAEAAIEHGVDKVILTGSATTGRALAQRLAHNLTPATMELSGCDSAFVTSQADLSRATSSIAYALAMNGGRSCIAPRRLFVMKDQVADFNEQFAQALDDHGSKLAQGLEVPKNVRTNLQSLIQAAQRGGARILHGSFDHQQIRWPVVLADVRPDMQIAKADLFAPVALVIACQNMQDAIEADCQCPYSLGSAIFGSAGDTDFWASRIDAGCVVINDVMVPTADPRVAFGGRDLSGWGVTRGPEGLLEMTRPKAICTRRGNWLPHLDSNSQNEAILAELLQLFHGTFKTRIRAVKNIIRYARES